MSDEKKTQNNAQHEKAGRQRKHGYFIQPADDTARAKNIQINTAGEDTAGKAHTHHQPHRPHKVKQQPAPAKAEQAQATAKAEQAQATAQAKPSVPSNQQPTAPAKKKNKHKNKNKSNAEKSTQSAPAAPARPPVREAKAHPTHSADEYEEYKLVVEDEPVVKAPDTAEQPKTEVVGIRFKSSGKIYYFDPQGLKLKKGSSAIVDTARGQEYGEVAMTNSLIRSSDIVPPLRTVVRVATDADIEHHKANKQKEEEAFKVCNEKIAAHRLQMKLIDAQYTFDNSKLLFYFTSAERVDFRELVKDLASVFRTRIELRQIGIRDEAKLMGGLGMCGRPLCCTLFLSDFDQVSIKMAKEQNLSLNSAKISGICGRLMCCLKYEHEAYEYEIKRTPPVDSLVRTENGDGVVTEISPLKGTVKVRLLASPDVPPKFYHRDDITMLRKKQESDKK